MNPDLQFLELSLNEICADCENPANCQDCIYYQMSASVEALKNNENDTANIQTGCNVCCDKKGKLREIFYLDNTNAMRESVFCPACGAKIGAKRNNG